MMCLCFAVSCRAVLCRAVLCMLLHALHCLTQKAALTSACHPLCSPPLCCSKSGSYAPGDKAATCAACPKGFQCPTNALRKEVACPRGTFSNREGLKACTPW